MAQYSTYTCTTRFSYDRDSSDNNISKSFLYIEENHSLQGIVHNVSAELGLRITTDKATRTNMAFVLFKFNDSIVPDGWSQKTTCYKGDTSFEDTDAFSNLDPYILAKTEPFTATWAGTALIKATFILTNLGKDIKNWNGRICLGVYQYGTGSHGCFWAWKKDTNFRSFYTLEYTAESSLKDVPVAVQLGNNFSVSINSYDSSYTHKIRLSLKSNSKEWDLSAGITTIDNLSFPKEWGNSFPSTTTSASGMIELFTYKDEVQIGSSNSKNITCSMTNYNYNGTNEINVSNFSKIAHNSRFKNSIFSSYLVSDFNSFELTASFDPTKNGATAKTISVTYNNQTKNIENNSSGIFTFLSNSSADKLIITVLDSRGATGTKTLSFPSDVTSSYRYLTYYPPAYEKIEYYRRSGSSSSASRDDINGQYITAKIVKFKPSYTSPNVGYYSYVDCSSPQLGSLSTYSRYSTSTTIDKIFAFTTKVGLDKFYDVNITISDQSDYSYAVPKGTVSSSNYLLHFGYGTSGQKSIGIGYAAKDLESAEYSKYAENGLLSIGYDVEFNRSLVLKNPLDVTQGGTGVNSYDGLKQMLGLDGAYLPLNGGGTITSGATDKLTISPQGLKYTNSQNSTAGLIYHNGTDFWIGATGLNINDHVGWVRIATGWTSPNKNTGFETIYIHKTNKDGDTANYAVLHTGNCNKYFESYTANYQEVGAILINSICYGYLTNEKKDYVFVVPIGKSLKNITKATLTKMYGHIRGGRGGYLVQDWTDGVDNNAVDFLSKANVTSLDGTIDYVTNCIEFHLKCSSSLGGYDNGTYTFAPHTDTNSGGIPGLIINLSNE